MNFMNSKNEFERNIILQSFQQLSYESQQRSKKMRIKKQRRIDDVTGASSYSNTES